MVAAVSKPVPDLVRVLRQQLRKQADPAKAAPMQAYMKSEMPYLGVPTPALRIICRKLFGEYILETPNEWRTAIVQLWRDAKYREERYAAIELASSRRYKDFNTPQMLSMYEEIVVGGAWWDYVDAIAPRIGELLRAHPREIGKAMRTWARADNMWKRRSAIICQLGSKRSTDLKLLYDCIEPSTDSEDVFLRKAIGWALREYAKTDAEAVITYLERNQKRLSPLSKREALKGLLRNGRIEVPA